ncbi:alpha/beta fold hydrolase [Carnobacterium iners]|nr:alpha/beta hydrolase [Carnobacterium iners]SEK88845.1 Pimeloyl-ACP methyl ester carboxylesterase [Carnobacterium iners]
MKDYVILINEDSLFCHVSGKGDPLLLLHGNEEDHTIFNNQIAYFSKFYQVFALDSRGHGRSDHGKNLLTFEKIVSDIIHVLDYFHLEKTAIIGFSDGGNVGLYLASHYPERVAELVVVGANYRPEGLRKKDFLQVKLLYGYLKWVGTISKSKQRRKEVIDLMWHQIKLNDNDLKRITTRTLIVVGENDVIQKSHTKKINDLIVKSILITLPETTHFLMIEKPDLFNSLVKDFLLETDRGG